MDNFNWGVRRPSLSHLEGGSSTSLSSASGFSHQAGALTSDGRDVGREKDKITRSEHRYKNSGKSQNTGMPNDHDRLGRNEVNQLGNAVSTGHDNHRNISPVLQNIGTNRNAGVGAEESSDDEMGSVRFKVYLRVRSSKLFIYKFYISCLTSIYRLPILCSLIF